VDLPYREVPERGIDGPPDESFVGLPGGQVPFGDGRVLVEEPGDGDTSFRRSPVVGLLEKPAQLDLGLDLVFDRGM
jgi:hypothetical protein